MVPNSEVNTHIRLLKTLNYRRNSQFLLIKKTSSGALSDKNVTVAEKETLV